MLPGVVLPVASTGHLLALKALARDDVSRPQDLVDLRSLLGAAGDDDLGVARRAAAAIVDRGFARGRDLVPTSSP